MGVGPVRTISVQLAARLGNYASTMLQAGQATRALSGELVTLSATSKSKFNDIAKVTTGIGVGLVAAFGFAEKAALDFDKQMSAVEAVMDKTGQTAAQSAAQLALLRQEAITAGQKTAFTATEAAQAEEELAKAGVSTKDILSGGLTGALNLASAGSIGLGDAAKYAAQAMVEFNLQGKDVGHIADVLTAGANKSVSDVAGLGDALGQAGTVAHQAGMSLDETVGVLALFSQHGLDGVEAGTTFKQMLLKLEGPSHQAAALMQSLGLTVYDANGNFDSAAVLAANLQKSLGGLTEAQRNAALSTIFGSRAVRGAIDLYNAGAAGVDEWTANVNDSGIAAKTAQTKLNNLSGDVKKLKGSLDALAITSSGSATSGLRFLAQGAEGALNKFSSLPAPLQETVSILGGVTGAALLAGTGLIKIKGAVSSALTSLSQMGPAGEKAATGLGKVGSFAGKLGIAGVAAYGAYEGLKAFGDWIVKESAPTSRNIEALATSLQHLSGGLGISGELAKTFGDNLSALSIDVSKVTAANVSIAALNAKAASFNATAPKYAGAGRYLQGVNIQKDQITQANAQQVSDIKALDTALASMVTSGGVAQANIALQDLAARQGLTASQFQALLALLPNYSKAADAAAQSNTGVAHGFADAAAKAQTMADTLDDLIDKGNTFEDVWKSLNGALLNSDQATLAANQSLETLKKTLKDNKDAWKGNSDAALADRIAIGDVADEAAKAADAKYQETGSVDAANKVYTTYIAQLRKTLLAAGLTKAQVDSLLASYTQMPPVVTTTFVAPNLGPVNDTATGYAAIVNSLDGKTVTTNFNFKVSDNQLSKIHNELSRYGANRNGGVYTHAAVGALRDASYFSPAASGARYAFAEPATGGEAFVPKYGNYQRSTSIIDQAAHWYGGRFAPGGGGGGGGSTSTYAPVITNNVYPQRANWTPQDHMAMQARTETMMRVGRRW